MIRFVNFKKNITQTGKSGKKFNKIMRLKTFVLHENNQPAPQCLAKRKTSTEQPKVKPNSSQYTK